MSPPRTPYRAPRRRREVVLAVLGVAAVLVFTGVMLWVLAPESDEPVVPPAVTTFPIDPAATSTLPGAPTDSSATTVPAASTTPTTAPPG